MSFIGKNIRKIRTVKKLSQADFAKLFNLARPSVGAYEEGRAEPKIETLIHIAQYFGLSTDALLTKELTINDLYKFDIFKNLKPEANQTIDRDASKEDTPLVYINNELEYIVNLHNKDFINNLPCIQLPTIKEEKTRAFEVSGNEMEYNNSGLHHGDFLLTLPTNKDDSKKLILGKIYVIVSNSKIYIRRLISKNNGLELAADNPSFESTRINIDEVLEIWEGLGVYSTYLKAPTMLEERMLTLEAKFMELSKRFFELERKVEN